MKEDEKYIVDTNILIYVSKADEGVLAILDLLDQTAFFISVISHFEFLNGHRDERHFKDLENLLTQLVTLDLTPEISKRAALLDRETKKKLKFKDLLIAATAQVEGLTLVTADKDFQKLKGLKVKLVKL
jgi:predicted nucleic acid-binding protein